MAYTYRNKKTGEVIYLNRRVKSAFWEEEMPEEEAPAEAPKKTTKSRGKK